MDTLALWMILGGAAAFWGYRFYQRVSREDLKVAALEQEKIQSFDQIDGFEPALIFEGLRGSYGLAIDPKSDQFAIAIPGHSARHYHFSQLVAVEAIRDGQTVTATTGKVHACGAAVATALIGPLGMALGARTTSTASSTATISKLALKLFVSDLHSPCFEIPFYGYGVPMPADNLRVVQAVRNLDEWYGRFRTILQDAEQQARGRRSAKGVQHLSPAPEPIPLSATSRFFTMR